MSYSPNIPLQSRLIDQTAKTIADNPDANSTDVANITSDVVTLEVDSYANKGSVSRDYQRLSGDVQNAMSDGSISGSDAVGILSPAAGMLSDAAVETGNAAGAQAVSSFFQIYCQNNNIPYTGGNFQQAWNTFTTTLGQSFPDLQSQFGGALQQAEQLAQTQFGGTSSTSSSSSSTTSTASTPSTSSTSSSPATTAQSATPTTASTSTSPSTTSMPGGSTVIPMSPAVTQLPQAMTLAAQAYVTYQAALNDPNATPADKQHLADVAFGKMERAYEMASAAGLNYGEFEQHLDSAVPQAFSALQSDAGQTVPGTSYSLNLGNLSAQSTTSSLNSWLSSQTDLDYSTMQAVETNAPGTANQGANFGTGFQQGFEQTAATQDNGQDPFQNPNLNAPAAPTTSAQAATSVGGATAANFQTAATLADQAYVEYQAAKNDPKASPADVQQLANAAFGKMQRAYEIASDAGMTYDQFQQGLDTSMPAAYAAAQQQSGTTLPGTSYTLNLGSVTAQSSQEGLDTWLMNQTDLDAGTLASVQNGGSETANQGANFGTTNFQGWLKDASSYDNGQDPFVNPNLLNGNGNG